MASCHIFRDNTGAVSKVTAPNGNESQLFADLNQVMPDKDEALDAWAVAYTDDFKSWFGDWERPIKAQLNDSGIDEVTLASIQGQLTEGMDTNGEPSYAAMKSFMDQNAAEMPMPLKGNEALYKKFNLINQYGQISFVKYSTPEQIKQTNDRIASLNRSPYYKFMVRQTPSGYKIFVFNKALAKNTQDANVGRKYFTESTETRSTEVLQKIADSGHPLNKLAGQLMSYAKLNDVKITLVPGSHPALQARGMTAAGIFYPGTNEIFINQDSKFRGAGSEPTIIHEILHSLTYHELKSNGEAVTALTNLFDYAKEKLGGYNDETGEGNYALRDLDEFIVGIFTDGKFVKQLLEIPAKPGEKEYANIFDQLFDYILGLFGITESNALYGQAYAVATNILEDFRKTTEQLMQDEEQYQLFQAQQDSQQDNLPDEFFASPQASEQELQQQVLNFLSQIGVSVETVDSITDASGQPISANAKADMLNRIIQVTEGSMDARTLGEEAAHFFVNMLGDNHPLMKQMMNDITSYQLYREIVELYKNLPEYRNPDGSVNFTKLKKEAIGQVISEHIIKGNTANETQEKITKLASWWEKVWKIITDTFRKAEDNPFAAAAQQIGSADTSNLGSINAEEGIYFSLASSIDLLKQEQNRLILDNSIDPVTKQKRHIYKHDGRPVKTSVTTAKVDAYYKKIFPNDRRDERQKELDLLKAEFGDAIHLMMESIYEAYIDPATGLVRDAKQPVVHAAAGTEIMKKLDGYFEQLIGSYPVGTMFMKEVKIYDPKADMAGSIDLLVIPTSGVVEIYDWKSQEIAKFQTEIKDFKPQAYRIQLGEYKRILREHYGFNKFGKVRAIPIRTQYVYLKNAKNEIDNLELKNIEIGDFNPAMIPDDQNYLLPVSVDETTGDKNLDKLIKKLDGIYKRIEQKKFKAAEKFKQKEELKRYRDAIRDLELRGSIDKFIELGNTEVARIRELMLNDALTPRDIRTALDTLSVFSSTSGIINKIIADYNRDIIASGNTQDIEALKELSDVYKQMTADAAATLEEVEENLTEIASSIAQRMGIENFEKSEKGVSFLAGTFNSLSQLDTKAIQTFYKMLRNVQNKRDADFNKMMTELHKHKDALEQWGKKKGITGDKLFDIMLDFKLGKWTGNFLKKYDSEFYRQRDQAIRTGDWKWIAENTEFDGERYEKERARKLEYYKEAKFMTDEKANAEAVSKAFYKWVDTHNILDEEGKPNQDGYLNPKNNFLKPSAKWHSAGWKELSAKGNEPAMEAYKYFQSTIRHAERLGMIDEYSPEFIPSMFKGKLDQLVFGGMNKGMFAGGDFFEQLAIDSGSQYFPDQDPVTGEVLNRVPVYFTRDIGVDDGGLTPNYDRKSKDLFKVFSIWGGHMYNYEGMSSLEDDVFVLNTAERNKESIVTNLFNEGKRLPNGELDTKPGNERNAKILQDFTNFYLYNRRTGEQFDVKVKMFGKTFSAQKSLQFILGFFSLKTLALNPLSGSAQFVGGTGNAFLLGTKKVVMNNDDWVKSMYLYTKRDSKAIAMLDYFDMLLEDGKRNKGNKLSVSKAVASFSLDNMYVFQRIADKAVQNPLAIAMMQNFMVDESGNLVNITNYVKDQMNYSTFYNLPAAERKEFKAKLEEQIAKLKQEKSLFATAKIENDELTIPGVDMGSENSEKFRAAVKKAAKTIIGNSTSDDINLIRTNSWGMALMQFRSWIPAMAKERFGNLYKDGDLDVYQYGKLNSLMGELFSVRAGQLLKGIVLGFGSDGAIAAAKARYHIMKADAYANGEEFNITEAEFIDMHIGNLKSAIREVMILIAFYMMLMAVKPGDDDEMDEYTGIRKYTARALSKYYNEFAFYYNPIEFTNLIKSPLPIISLAEDTQRFLGATLKQGWGVATGDSETTDEARPLKYLFRLMPITKEVVQMTAIFDDDFRKEWGIRIQ
jgi:hypothetical protein